MGHQLPEIIQLQTTIAFLLLNMVFIYEKDQGYAWIVCFSTKSVKHAQVEVYAAGNNYILVSFSGLINIYMDFRFH